MNYTILIFLTAQSAGSQTKILPIVKEWQERPLEEVYAVVFMDAIHYHVRSEGRIVKRAVYIALGIDMNGKKMFLECMLEKTKVQSSGFLSSMD